MYFTLPPLNELISVADLEMLNEATGFGDTLTTGIRFQLETRKANGANNGNDRTMICVDTTPTNLNTDLCDVTFHHTWTPRLVDTIPNQVYKD